MNEILNVKIIMVSIKSENDIKENKEPFCLIKFADQEFKTLNQNQNHNNIKKDEFFEFNIPEDADNILKIELINSDEPYNILGSGEMDVSNLKEELNSLELFSKNKTLIGTLKLNLKISFSINKTKTNNKNEVYHDDLDDDLEILIENYDKILKINLSLKENIYVFETKVKNTLVKIRENKFKKEYLTDKEQSVKKELDKNFKKNAKLIKERDIYKNIFNQENKILKLETLEHKKNLINNKISKLVLEKNYQKNNMDSLSEEVNKNKNNDNYKLILDDIKSSNEKTKEELKIFKEKLAIKDNKIKDLNEIFIRLESTYRSLCNKYSINNTLNINSKSQAIIKPLVLNKLKINKSIIFKEKQEKEDNFKPSKPNYDTLIANWKEIEQKRYLLRKKLEKIKYEWIKTQNKNEILLKDLKEKEGIVFLLRNKLKEIKYLKKKNVSSKNFNIKLVKNINTSKSSRKNFYNKEEIYRTKLSDKEIKSFINNNTNNIDESLDIIKEVTNSKEFNSTKKEEIKSNTNLSNKLNLDEGKLLNIEENDIDDSKKIDDKKLNNDIKTELLIGKMSKTDNEQLFDDEIIFIDPNKVSTGINKIVYSNDDNYIKSIQCFYLLNNNEVLIGNKYGNSKLKEKIISIPNDEKIIKILNNYEQNKGIHFIKFVTNKNEYIIGNSNKKANTHQEFEINEQQNIKWISGGYYNKNITYLAFHLNNT